MNFLEKTPILGVNKINQILGASKVPLNHIIFFLALKLSATIDNSLLFFNVFFAFFLKKKSLLGSILATKKN